MDDRLNWFLDDGEEHGEGPKESRDHAEAEELPELPAPSSGRMENEPARGGINLGDVDPDLAMLHLCPAIRVAHAAIPEISEEDVLKLVRATIERVLMRARGGFLEGISISELAQKGGIGTGRIGERFNTLLVLFANLTVRALHAGAFQRVFYEEIGSHPAQVGRRHNGVGTDKLPGLSNSLHLLDHNLGASNRHCCSICEVLATGTRWDRTAPRFGTALPDWASDVLEQVPGSYAEHLERMLRIDRATRERLFKALKEGWIEFEGGITERRLLAAFSPYLILPQTPHSPPLTPYRSHGDVHLPGRDPAAVEVAKESGRHVILSCGEPTASELVEFEERSEALTVGRLPSMYELDIHRVQGIEYRWSPKRHELGRYQAGKGAGLEIWRFVNCEDEAAFWRMVSLAERQAQVTWTEECNRRWERDCKPGLQKAHMPDSCSGVRALLVMANAAIVDALRWGERRKEGG